MVQYAILLVCSASLCAAEIAGIPHPRLLWPEEDEARVERAIAEDPLARELADHVFANTREILTDRTCHYEIPDGKRLLAESRRALRNITHCAWAWRMTREPRFLERAIRELDSACALKDWNPRHFLDTAEMAFAVATGYDWLYQNLSSDQRRRYEDAIITKALLPAKDAYRTGAFWTLPSSNWSQVCGGSIALAAAAVAERDSALCLRLFEQGRELVEGCKVFYEPDGGYPEGPTYWHYGSNYHIFMLAACESLGYKTKLPDVWQRSGDFMVHIVGPTRLPFNFADAGPDPDEPTPAQGWLSRELADAGQARHIRTMLRRAMAEGTDTRLHGVGRHFPLHLIWLPTEPPDDCPEEPLAARFAGKQPIAMFRSSWKTNAAYLAIKGGTALASHGQMDVGSFVYDADGVRWFHDMGSDDYNMPGYFGKQRWSYFRLTNRSHNTLVIDGKLQHLSDKPAAMMDVKTGGGTAKVTFDLGPAYLKQAEEVRRTASFDHATGTATIEDLVKSPVGPVRWAVITKAAIRIEGPRVLLEQAGKTLVVTRRDGNGGEWKIGDATPSTSRENQNRGFHILYFTAPPARTLDLRVSWVPHTTGAVE